MAQPSVHQGDLYVKGNLSAQTQTLANDAVQNVNVAQPTGGGTSMGTDFIDADKMQHYFKRTHVQPHGSAAVSERVPIHIAGGPGIVEDIRISGMVACIGAATIVVAVKKNGVTNLLSGTLQLDSADVAFASVVGTIDGATDNYVDGDVFDVQVTATAGGGTLGQGLIVQVTFREDPFA